MTHPSAGHPGLERVPGKQNWIDRLPTALKRRWHRSVIYRAAKHMVADSGMPVGIAIASAINWARHICRTGDVKQWRGRQDVRPQNRAEACAAVAIWNTMKATARATDQSATQAATLDMAQREGWAIDLAQAIPTGERQQAFQRGRALPPARSGRRPRFPIRNLEELRNAIRMVQLARGPKPPIRRYIMRRAREMGASDRIPSHWRSDGTLGSRS